MRLNRNQQVKKSFRSLCQRQPTTTMPLSINKSLMQECFAGEKHMKLCTQRLHPLKMCVVIGNKSRHKSISLETTK